MLLSLRRYFESLLGVEPVAPGEDTQWRLRFSLGWPDWVVFLFFVVAVAFVVGIYLREGGRGTRGWKLFLAGIRLALVVLVVVMLGNLEISIDRTGLPYLVFMVDESESMGVRDRRDSGAAADPASVAAASTTGASESEKPARPASRLTDPTRLESVQEWLSDEEGKRLADLTKQYKLQFYAHAGAPRLIGTAIKPEEVTALLDQIRQLKPTGTESRLGANLRSVLNSLRGTPPSSVVMLTDGMTTEGEPLSQAAQYAARKSIPVFTIGVGDPGGVRDLELHDLLVDNVVFVDDIVTFEAKLTGRGFEGQQVSVALREKGIPTPLDEQTYRVGPDGKPTRVRLTHRPTKPGMVDYVLDMAVQPRELQKENNRIERQIQVLKEKIRVLYVESFPRYEFRFLKSLLEREPTIELGVLLLDSDPEFIQQDKSAIGFFPTGKKDLFTYDVLIFGDIPPTFFSQAQLEMVKEFVRVKGGGVLFIAGEQFSPYTYRETLLADLLPVELGPASNRDATASASTAFTPKLTVEGRASPIFRFAGDESENESIVNALPPLYWFARVEKAKPGAQILAEHPTEQRNGQPLPVVATQFFGAGRTYFQAFDSTWRWRYRHEDRYFARYWVQTVRYLSRSKLLGKNRSVELLVERQKYRRGEPVQLRARFLDESLAPRGDGVTVTLEHERLGVRTVELKASPQKPAVFEGAFTQTEDGKYRARLTSPLVEGSPPTAEFSVAPPPGEMDRVQMNEPELRLVAETTGAKFLPLSDADALFASLPPGRRVALHTDPPFALWNTWPMLVMFVGLLAVEWIVRKWKSML